MDSVIRRADAGDGPAIRAVVRRARLYPFDLDWRNFLVAEVDGRLAGVVQMRPHRDGCRELASLAVIDEFQGRGLGRALIDRLLAEHPAPVHLMCAERLCLYYAQSGFVELAPAHAPRSLRRKVNFGNRLMRLFSAFGQPQPRIAVMVRTGGAATTMTNERQDQ